MPRSAAGSVVLCTLAVVTRLLCCTRSPTSVAPRGVCDRGDTSIIIVVVGAGAGARPVHLVISRGFPHQRNAGYSSGPGSGRPWDCRRASALPLIAANVVCLSLRDPAPARWEKLYFLPLRRPSTAPYRYPQLLKALHHPREGCADLPCTVGLQSPSAARCLTFRDAPARPTDSSLSRPVPDHAPETAPRLDRIRMASVPILRHHGRFEAKPLPSAPRLCCCSSSPSVSPQPSAAAAPPTHPSR